MEATVVEELPSLLYRLELSNKAKVLAHGAGAGQKNWVRLLPGDRVEVEFSEHDLTRGQDSEEGKLNMKVRASVKKICVKCKLIHRQGVVRVICVNPKHKQRQG